MIIMSDEDASDENADIIREGLQELFDQIVELNSGPNDYMSEFGDPLHPPGQKGITTDEQLVEVRKKKAGQIIDQLASHVQILKHAAENRRTGTPDDETEHGKITEMTGEIDGELRKTIERSNKLLEQIKTYFDCESLQEEWNLEIESQILKHSEEIENFLPLLSNNVFLESITLTLLPYYTYQGNSSSTPNTHSFMKALLIYALDSVYGCITALTSHMLNLNKSEQVEKLLEELSVESYGDAARQLLSNSEVLAANDYAMSKEQADDINTILHSLTWSMRKFSTTLESLPIGEGRYKPTLSDVNSHVATDSFRPRETYKNLGMWPLEREKDYYSLSELDLNNWIGHEQHSQNISVAGPLHRITYRDFIDFIQTLGYEHKKVTAYRGFRRSKPALTMYDWDERQCKYRPNAHIYFYNPQCPISGTEMRIVVESLVYQGGGDLNVHVGLDLFPLSEEMNHSNDLLYEEQILSIRENAENFVRKLWKDFDTYQREKGLLKNSKFDAMISQINPKGRTFDDMILSDSKKKLLDENIFAILSNSERLIERGVETNRGIMLAGPPGVGKSLTIDAVISKAECTVVFTNFMMLRENMEWIFELSRRYAPTVLILEDIDALGITGQRGEAGSGAGLSTLLNCMDGINSNNGVISVATSNHPEQMDWALIARPGRFDVRIDYPYPEKEVLKSIMELKLSSYQADENIDLDALVKKMPLGFTGSHIHDIVNQANYISINNSKAAAKKVKITQESLASATERTLYNFHKFLDERPHIQLQNPPSVQEVLKGSKGKKEDYHQ